jgi:hypothetical protein
MDGTNNSRIRRKDAITCLLQYLQTTDEEGVNDSDEKVSEEKKRKKKKKPQNRDRFIPHPDADITYTFSVAIIPSKPSLPPFSLPQSAPASAPCLLKMNCSCQVFPHLLKTGTLLPWYSLTLLQN